MTQKTQKYKYVPIKAQTKIHLDNLAKKGQTYDQILRLLIEKWHEQ